MPEGEFNNFMGQLSVDDLLQKMIEEGRWKDVFRRTAILSNEDKAWLVKEFPGGIKFDELGRELEKIYPPLPGNEHRG